MYNFSARAETGAEGGETPPQGDQRGSSRGHRQSCEAGAQKQPDAQSVSCGKQQETNEFDINFFMYAVAKVLNLPHLLYVLNRL